MEAQWVAVLPHTHLQVIGSIPALRVWNLPVLTVYVGFLWSSPTLQIHAGGG